MLQKLKVLTLCLLYIVGSRTAIFCETLCTLVADSSIILIVGTHTDKNNPVGIWCQSDVVSTSMRRHHVASTLIRRHF